MFPMRIANLACDTCILCLIVLSPKITRLAPTATVMAACGDWPRGDSDGRPMRLPAKTKRRNTSRAKVKNTAATGDHAHTKNGQGKHGGITAMSLSAARSGLTLIRSAARPCKPLNPRCGCLLHAVEAAGQPQRPRVLRAMSAEIEFPAGAGPQPKGRVQQRHRGRRCHFTRRWSLRPGLRCR